MWNIPHEHDLPNEVNTTDSHRQRSLWFSSPCVQKLHESLLKCHLPTTEVTGDQTKCISEPLKPKKQNAICNLEPQETTSPVASVMNIIKDKHLCKRKKKKKKNSLELLSFHARKTPKQSFTIRVTGPAVQSWSTLLCLLFRAHWINKKKSLTLRNPFPPRNGSAITLGIVKTSQMAPAVCFYVFICAETVALRLRQHEVEQNKSIVARESRAFCTNLHQKYELEASGQTEPSNPAFKHICNTLKSMYMKQPPPLPSTTLPQSPDSRCVTPVDRRWGRRQESGMRQTLGDQFWRRVCRSVAKIFWRP